MLGAKESMNSNFTEEGFIKAYSSFIKEFESMPSKPLFILVTPIYSAASVVNSDKSKPFKLNELDGTNFETDNYPHLVQTRKTDMAIQVVKVAEANKIPFENVVDSEKLLKADNQNTMNDTIHPNEHGYGILAQELYMRLAMSRNLKQRVM